MAKETVETKVVQVRFDNTKFSKNINTTIKQCEKLDKTLKFKGDKKGFQEIQKAVKNTELKELNKELDKTDSIINKISVSFMELAKIKLLSKAMDVVINKTNSMVKSLLGINNVIAGWQQYETQMTNVGGILNQVESKGYGLEDVADAMERLRWYTDETSFNFTTLSNGIRQFVIAGIDLNTAAEAAMGVTNLAGSAKVFDEYKVQSAMDAVSKAMQTGYMDTLKWTSLTNTAGIVTEEFSQKLLDQAVAQGKLVKSAAGQYKTKKGGKLVTTENIRSTLSEKWLTSDVLANVMDQYASASSAVEKFSGLMEYQTEDALAEINAMFKESGIQFESFDEILSKLPEDVEDSTELSARQTGKLLENLGYQFDEISYKAFKSAQETTSFSQALTYVKKAISTQWANIFEKIFGDYETATGLWSDISDKFYSTFVHPFEVLTDTFDSWTDLAEGGAEDFRNVIRIVIDVIGRFKDAVGNGFRAVFGELNESILQKITIALERFFTNFKNNEALFKAITAITKIFASVLKIVGKVSSTIFKIQVKLLTALEPIFEVVVDILDVLADGLIWIIDYIDELGILDAIVNALSTVLGYLADGIKKVINWIKGKIDVQKVTEKIASAVDKLRIAIEFLIDKIKIAANAIKEWWQQNEIAQKITEGFANAISKTKSFFSGFKKSTEEVSEGLEELNESGDNASKKLGWLDGFKAAFKNFGTAFKTILANLKNILADSGVIEGLKSFWNVLKEILIPIWETISGFFKGIAELVKTDPIKAVQKIVGAIFAILGILVILRIASMMRAVEWVIGELYSVLKAFKKKLLAERWKALATALLMITASILILTIVIEKIEKLDAKKAWKSLAMVFALFVMFGAMLALMSSKLFQGNLLSGFKIAAMMISLGIGITAFILAFNKLLKVVTSISISDVIKAGVMFAVIMGLMVGVIAVTFKKGEKKGLFKGDKVIGPGLFKLAKVLLFVWAFLKITLWFIKEINKFDTGELVKAGITIVAIFGIISTLLLAFNNLKKSKTSSSETKTARLTVELGSIGFIILAAVAVMKIASGLEWSEIGKGAATIGAIFGIIVLLSIGLAYAAKISQREKVRPNSINFGTSVMALSLSVLIAMFAFKQIASLNLSISDVIKYGLLILALYGVIGGIAIALAALSKVIKVGIGRKGLYMQGAKSPIGMAILAITTSVLLAAYAFKYLAGIDEETFEVGLQRFKNIMTYMTILTILLVLASRKAEGAAKGVIALLVALEVIVVTVIVLGALLTLEDKMQTYVDNGLYLLAKVAIGIVAFIMFIGAICKYGEIGLKKSGAIVMIIGVLVAFIFSIVALINVLKDVEDNELKRAFQVISAAAIVLIAFITLFFLASKLTTNLDVKKSMLLITNILIMVAGIAAIIAGVYLLMKNIDKKDDLLSIIIPIVAIAGALLISLTLIVLIGKMANKVDKKSIIMISVIMALFVGAILTMVYALERISNIKDPNNIWRNLSILGAITGALVVSMALMVLISWIVNKVNLSSLIMINVIMAVFITSILGILFAMIIVSEMDDKSFKRAATTVGVIAAALIAMVFLVVLISKSIKGTDYVKVALIAAIIWSISLSILTIAVALYMVSTIPEEALMRSLSTIMVLTLTYTALIILMGLLTQGGLAGATLSGVLIILAIAGAIAIMAGALLLIASVPADKLEDSIKALLIILGVFTVALLLLGALGTSGIGEIGVVLLIGLAGAFLILSGALLVSALAIDVMTDSVIKLMNELTPEKINNLKEFSKALLGLAGGTILNALTDFGAAILGLGSSIANGISGIFNGVGSFFEGIGSFVKGIGENKEAKALERKTKAYEDFANAMIALSNIDQDKINGVVKDILDFFESNIDNSKIDSITLCLMSFVKYFDTLAKYWIDYQDLFAQITNFLYYTVKTLSTPDEVQITYFDQLMTYLDKLKETIDEIGNPTITPILDLTKFNEGLGQINGALMQSKELLNDYVAASASRAYAGQVQPNPYMGGASGSGNGYMVVNNNFNLNDSYSYGYDANRSIANTIADALSKAVNFPANAFDKIAKFFGG